MVRSAEIVAEILDSLLLRTRRSIMRWVLCIVRARKGNRRDDGAGAHIAMCRFHYKGRLKASERQCASASQCALASRPSAAAGCGHRHPAFRSAARRLNWHHTLQGALARGVGVAHSRRKVLAIEDYDRAPLSGPRQYTSASGSPSPV